MRKNNPTDIDWANPSQEDLAYLRTLSREEHGELLSRASKEAAKKGIGTKSIEEIFDEAVEKAADAA